MGILSQIESLYRNAKNSAICDKTGHLSWLGYIRYNRFIYTYP